MWESIKTFLEQHMMQCFYKKHFGVECPGCGTQRAILKLLDGDLVGSFKMYPPLFLVLLTLLFLVLHLIFKFKKGGEILKYLGVGSSVFVFLNYLYRVILLGIN